jgi:hypothetical protein
MTTRRTYPFMFIGYKTFFTKREAILFIEVLLIAMRDAVAPKFLIKFSYVLHRMVCCWSELSTNDFKDVLKALDKMHLSYPEVEELLSMESRSGSYYRPRYDRVGDSIIDQQGLARWIESIDNSFLAIANRVWGGIFDDMFSKMVEAKVDNKIIDELAHYMKLRNVYARPSESRAASTLQYLGPKPKLRLVVNNT